MTMQVNIGGVYKNVTDVCVNIGGVWKCGCYVYSNIGGVWKDGSPSYGNYYELLSDITVGTATTSVDITSLALAKTDEILLVSDIVNTSASTSNYLMYFNNNTTATNYYYQSFTANSTTRTATRINSALMLDAAASAKSLVISKIKLTNNGYIVAQHESAENYGSGIILGSYYPFSKFTATSISQVTITASVADAIGVGSRFQLYRMGGA